MLKQNFGVTNKEHYGMLCYFLEGGGGVGGQYSDFDAFAFCALLIEGIVPNLRNVGVT